MDETVRAFVESTLEEVIEKSKSMMEKLRKKDNFFEFQKNLLSGSSFIVTEIASALEIFNPSKSKLKMFPILDSIVFKESSALKLANLAEFKLKREYPEIARFLLDEEETEGG